MKESFPIQTAEYAVVNKLVEEPTFAWWIKDILKKRDQILSKVKTRYWKHTHKYGLELPKMVKEVLEIDWQMGTDFWRKAIEKEMKNVMPAFQFTEDGKIPIGYKHIDCHMIFDIKMDLTRKAWLVAGGHQMDPPKESVYSSIISKDSVRIILMIAALNDLDILAARCAECIPQCTDEREGLHDGRPRVWAIMSRSTGHNHSCSVWIEVKWCLVA